MHNNKCMSLCRNLILVISHLFAPFFLVRKNLSSFGFYKSHIKTFRFGMWAIFVQDGPRLPASTSQVLVRECSHILLRTDSCIFQLFSRNVGTHALYNNLFRNCSLLSSFLAFSLCLLHCCIPPPLWRLDKNCCNKCLPHGFIGLI